MNNTLKGIITGAGSTLLAGGIVLFLTKGSAIWHHVDVAGVSVSEMQAQQQSLREDVDKRHEALLVKINANIEANRIYGEQISQAVNELTQVKLSLLTKPVRGSATRDIGAAPIGKNIIWVNRYSDARDFAIGEQVKVSSSVSQIEAEVGGYILDERQGVIFKANTDVANQIGLSERLGKISGVEVQRIVPN